MEFVHAFAKLHNVWIQVIPIIFLKVVEKLLCFFIGESLVHHKIEEILNKFDKKLDIELFLQYYKLQLYRGQQYLLFR